MKKVKKIHLSNGFILEDDPTSAGHFYYYRLGVLMNRISWKTITNHLNSTSLPDFTFKIWEEIAEAASRLEDTDTI